MKSNVVDLRQLLTTKSILESICTWNAVRYNQEHNEKLTIDLLYEELNETLEAMQALNQIETCDGFGDVFFVAIGALWKMGISDKEMGEYIDSVDSSLPLVPPTPVAVQWVSYDCNTYTLAVVALAAVADLTDLLDSSDAAFDVIRAICESNNSKVVKKTEAGVKANIDKGENYFAPTRQIAKILLDVNKGVYNARKSH